MSDKGALAPIEGVIKVGLYLSPYCSCSGYADGNKAVITYCWKHSDIATSRMSEIKCGSELLAMLAQEKC